MPAARATATLPIHAVGREREAGWGRSPRTSNKLAAKAKPRAAVSGSPAVKSNAQRRPATAANPPWRRLPGAFAAATIAAASAGARAAPATRL